MPTALRLTTGRAALAATAVRDGISPNTWLRSTGWLGGAGAVVRATATASGNVGAAPVVDGSSVVVRPGDRLAGVSSAAPVVDGSSAVTWVPRTACPDTPRVVDGFEDDGPEVSVELVLPDDGAPGETV